MKAGGSRRKPMPLEAWCSLSPWMEQAERFERTGDEGDRPDNRLLVRALQAGAIPGVLPPVRLGADGAIECRLQKPAGEGTSKREMDAEGAALLALLVLPGGCLFLDVSGESHEFFYGRLYIRGCSTMPYVARILAETEAGTQTREGSEFHSWCRRHLALRPPAGRDTVGRHGMVGAKQLARDAFAKINRRFPEMLPAGLTEERYAELLELAHRRMSAVPLGKGGPAGK